MIAKLMYLPLRLLIAVAVLTVILIALTFRLAVTSVAALVAANQ